MYFVFVSGAITQTYPTEKLKKDNKTTALTYKQEAFNQSFFSDFITIL